jgi:hypothetical protein
MSWKRVFPNPRTPARRANARLAKGYRSIGGDNDWFGSSNRVFQLLIVNTLACSIVVCDLKLSQLEPGAKMRTISWECTKSDGWNWRGANDVAVTGEPNQMKGTIDLEANTEFWYLCGYLFLDGKTVGTAGIRRYQEGGQDLVQVFTDARGSWHDQPDGNTVASKTGETGKSGGISLTAAFAK